MSLYFAGRCKHMIETILLSKGVFLSIKNIIYSQTFKIINMIQKINITVFKNVFHFCAAYWETLFREKSKHTPAKQIRKPRLREIMHFLNVTQSQIIRIRTQMCMEREKIFIFTTFLYIDRSSFKWINWKISYFMQIPR